MPLVPTPFLEEARIPLSWVPITPQRNEYYWQRRSSRCLAILYCFGCCLAFMLGIRDSLNSHPSFHQRRPLTHSWNSAMPQTVLTDYLLRSRVTPMYTLEPFVLVGQPTTSAVTICAWTYDTEIRHLESWLYTWAGPASILVVTPSKPEDKVYQDILTYISYLQSKPMAHHLSIHLLQIQEGEPSPNAWLNLAQLFVRTDYILLWPGNLFPALPSHITATTVSKSLIPDKGAYVLGSRVAAYPFVSLVPILIQSNGAFWCTERLIIGRNRENDWDECLWQFSLEFGPAVRLWQDLDLYNRVTLPRIAASDMLLRHRLRNRVRAESCDAVYKRVIAVEPSAKMRMGRVDWMRKYCARVRDDIVDSLRSLRTLADHR